MALLNYSSSFLQSGQAAGISTYINATVGTAEWLKIFVSPDSLGGGHFITHGIDFGRTYDGGRGLVPANSAADTTKTFLRGDGWSSLWSSSAQEAAAGNGTTAQQQANIESYLQSTLVSAYDIKQWINQSFSANDAMRYKGTITVSQDDSISHNSTGTSVSGFPISCEVGDTYKVKDTENKQLAGQNVNTGDLLICIKDGSSGNLNSSSYWTVVQSNVEHLSTYVINGNGYKIYTQSYVSNLSWYAPVSAGTTGQVLLSAGSGNAPVWANQNTLTVKEAGKVTYALGKGTGLSFTSQGSGVLDYNGSQAVVISLLAASTTQLGGVTIDAGTHSPLYDATNAPTTYKPTISISSGEIYLTADNIKNALGYVPGNASGQVTAIKVTSSASGTSNASSATANPYVNIIDSSQVLGSFRISGSGNVSVQSVANSAAVVVGLDAATSDNYGGIKIGYSTSGKNYAVQLSDGKAYVNVPWVSDVFSASANGLVPMSSNANKQTNNADNVVANTTFLLGADAKWYKLPSSAFVGTWRNIQVGGTEILNNDSTGNNAKPLNLVGAGHTTVTAENASGYTGKVIISSTWRDIQIHQITNNTIAQNVASISNNDPLVFDNSESIFTVGEEVTISGTQKKTVVKSYITWYNLDTGEYELV